MLSDAVPSARISFLVPLPELLILMLSGVEATGHLVFVILQ
jgi:hypothetical protein